MAYEGQTKGLTPPYVGFATFKGFVGELAAAAVPPQIDASVMTGKSGGTQAALRVALHFLGLIERDRTVTARLHEVVQAHGSDRWSETVRDLALAAYAPVIDALPLKTGTAKQLEDAFRERSDVTGSTLSKVVSFFLQILKEGNVEISTHFRAPKRKRAKAKRLGGTLSLAGGGGSDDEGESTNDEDEELRVPAGWVVQPFNLPGRDDAVRIIMPTTMTAREWKMVSAYMTLYVQSNET